MKTYVETGSIQTPPHGRGKRILKKNAKYDGDYDDDANESMAPAAKVPRKSRKPPQKEFQLNSEEAQKLRQKYNLGCTKENDEGDADEDCADEDCADEDCADEDCADEDCADEDCADEDGASNYEFESIDNSNEEIERLKKENMSLKTKLKAKECEVKHLESVIRNLKDMPILNDVAMEIRKYVQQIQLFTVSTTTKHKPTPSLKCDQENSSPLPTTRCISSPASCPPHSITKLEANQITICPHVTISRDQNTILKGKGNMKDYVYALMSMLWSRDVLAKHSISGRLSNAFKDKEAKPQLNPEKVQRICEYAAKRFSCKEVQVKQIMTAKLNNIAKVLKAQSRLNQAAQLDS